MEGVPSQSSRVLHGLDDERSLGCLAAIRLPATVVCSLPDGKVQSPIF